MRPIITTILILLTQSGTVAAEPKPVQLIGYTEGRNDLPDGQFANWVTNRACTVKADGTGRRVLAEELAKKPHAWTQFAGWSPDGKTAIVGSHWESPENAAWEREHKTFRMTEGWLSDTCLLDLATGRVTNVTAVDRVSAYNTGLFYLPDGKGFGFTPLIAGVSKPFVMDPDGKNKRDVSGRVPASPTAIPRRPTASGSATTRTTGSSFRTPTATTRRRSTPATRSTSRRPGRRMASGSCSSRASTTTAIPTS